MLKCSFHLHTASDHRDCLPYSNQKAIDKAAECGFEVIAITCHNKVIFSKELKEYAAKKNILLIPGIEKSIQKRHVLILNADKDAENIHTFKDLRILRKHKNWLTIIAHPFFPPFTLWSQNTINNMDVFDAIELSYFYSKTINFNKKAREIAKRMQKPLIGTSDIHLLKLFDPTYTLIYAEKNIDSIFSAIRKHKIEIATRPFSSYQLPLIFGEMLLTTYYGRIKRSINKAYKTSEAISY